MRPYRVLALVVVLAAAFAGQSLVVRSAQSGGDGSAGPFDHAAFPADRAGVDVGPHLGSGGLRGEPVDLLRRHRARRRVENDEQRHDVRAAVSESGADRRSATSPISQSNPDLVWVGTGESNNRQSTSWGDGVYKSTDGGKTYTNMGLKTSRHINRIVIDPRNNDIVFVAADRPLFGPGGERGVYKTDGRRQDLEAGAEGRRRHRRQRPGDGSAEQPDSLRVDVSAAAHAVLHERRRSGQRHLEVHRRRRHVEASAGRRSAGWPARTDRPRRLSPAARTSCTRCSTDRRRPRPGAGQPNDAPPQAPGGGRSNVATTRHAVFADRPLRSDDSGATWRKVNDANPRPMYFSQVRIDPNDPEVVIYGGVGSALLERRRENGQHRIAASTIHSDVPRDLDQPGELEPRHDRQRRRGGGELGSGEDVELRATTCRSASSIT